MIEINLGDVNVVENFKALNELRSTGLFSDSELQEMYKKQVVEDMKEDFAKELADGYVDTDIASAYASTLMDYPHICRMQVERDELLHNMAKLSNYYEDHFSELTEKQRDYMCKQLTAMRAYADILQQRITYDIQYYSYNTK